MTRQHCTVPRREHDALAIDGELGQDEARIQRDVERRAEVAVVYDVVDDRSEQVLLRGEVGIESRLRSAALEQYRVDRGLLVTDL
jgi:hypothetical protein